MLYSNTEEFYITVFSNSSLDLYKHNTLSKFQVQLPKPISFNPNEKWYVALTDIAHAPILNVGEQIDEIVFKKEKYCSLHQSDVLLERIDPIKNIEEKIGIAIIDNNYFLVNEEDYQFIIDEWSKTKRRKLSIVFVPETYYEKVGTSLWSSAKQPFMYDEDYFSEFLKIDNLKKFINNDGELLKYETKIDYASVENESKTIFLVPPGQVVQKFRNASEILSNDPKKSLKEKIEESNYIVFEYDKQYTGRQIMWIIISKLKHILQQQGSNSEEILKDIGIKLQKDEILETESILLKVVEHLVNTFKSQFEKYKKIKAENCRFIFIYCDFIKPRIVGNNFANILYIMSRPNEEKAHTIVVNNYQYLPVNKSYIESLSFRLTNEYGEQLYLHSG